MIGARQGKANPHCPETIDNLPGPCAKVRMLKARLVLLAATYVSTVFGDEVRNTSGQFSA